MASSKDYLSFLEPCIDPPILMGDDTHVHLSGKGVID
jgi:hypothetical protein